jgi:hypothetical protein
VARVAILAGLAAFAVLTGAQTFDQPRPRGAEIAREQAPPPRGPTPPFAGAGVPIEAQASSHARGCPRETLARFSVLESWLRALPLGGVLGAVAVRELVGSCSSA